MLTYSRVENGGASRFPGWGRRVATAAVIARAAVQGVPMRPVGSIVARMVGLC